MKAGRIYTFYYFAIQSDTYIWKFPTFLSSFDCLFPSFLERVTSMSARAISEACGKRLLNENLPSEAGAAICRFAAVKEDVKWDDLAHKNAWLTSEVRMSYLQVPFNNDRVRIRINLALVHPEMFSKHVTNGSSLYVQINLSLAQVCRMTW